MTCPAFDTNCLGPHQCEHYKAGRTQCQRPCFPLIEDREKLMMRLEAAGMFGAAVPQIAEHLTQQAYSVNPVDRELKHVLVIPSRAVTRTVMLALMKLFDDDGAEFVEPKRIDIGELGGRVTLSYLGVPLRES